MDRVKVAAHASDAVTFAGLSGHLRARPELLVVPMRQVATADVLVIVTDAVTTETMDLLRAASSQAPVRTVLVTDHFSERDLFTAIECRMVTILRRSAAHGDRLVKTVLAASKGHAEFPPDLLGSLVRQVERLQRDILAPNGLTASGLASREINVLRLMADGADTEEIAKRLCYSERTVKNVLHMMMSRLNLRNRPHAVAYAMRAGVI